MKNKNYAEKEVGCGKVKKRQRKEQSENNVKVE